MVQLSFFTFDTLDKKHFNKVVKSFFFQARNYLKEHFFDWTCDLEDVLQELCLWALPYIKNKKYISEEYTRRLCLTFFNRVWPKRKRYNQILVRLAPQEEENQGKLFGNGQNGKRKPLSFNANGPENIRFVSFEDLPKSRRRLL